jgi:hypothetical protein
MESKQKELEKAISQHRKEINDYLLSEPNHCPICARIRTKHELMLGIETFFCDIREHNMFSDEIQDWVGVDRISDITLGRKQ